jgi:hypothetical protein
MSQLEKFPSGAEVKVCTVKDEEELEIMDEENDIKTYSINFAVRECSIDDNVVEIDIY